jgi:hypothetical protein
MPDSQTSQAAPGSAEQSSAQQTSQPSAQAAPAGYVEVARLNGALQKIEQLTLSNQALTASLNDVTQKYQALQQQAVTKEAEWNAKAGEFTTKLTAAEQSAATSSGQVQKFEAQNLKLKLIGETRRPELYAMLDVIPDGDEAATKAFIQKMGTFADGLVKSREHELLAGVTHTETVVNTKPLPTTEQGWSEYINSFPLGTKERADAMNEWHKVIFK